MVEIPNAGPAADDDDDMDDGMRCTYHPYRTNQGGICALCLQEKLGKLVSSSSPLPLRASSSSSSSSSFRSDFAAGTGAGYSAASSVKFRPENGGHCHDHHAARNRIPFLKKKKKKQPEVGFRRSKSTTTPGRGKFLDPYGAEDYNPKNRGWIRSLFDLSTKSHSSRKIDQGLRESSKIASLPTAAATSVKQKENCAETFKNFSGTVTAEEDGGGDEDSPNSSQATASVSSFERKVSRSRSVGCGSRSFSGDFFERITGFGDCTLRRVESHREGKPKITSTSVAGVHDGGECLKERVKCGGIFGGFMIQTSSSSSSASSSNWVSSSSGEEGRYTAAPPYGQGRSKNRGWAFASPMRAIAAKPSSSSSEGKRESSTQNLDAIPSLLSVRI